MDIFLLMPLASSLSWPLRMTFRDLGVGKLPVRTLAASFRHPPGLTQILPRFSDSLG